jgi:hypothetical protein
MSEVRIAYGLGQYVRHEPIKVGKNGTPAIKVYYTRQDGEQKGKEQSVQYLVGKLDEASKAILKEASASAGLFNVVKEKKETDEYYNFVRFQAADTFVEKEKKPWTGGKQWQAEVERNYIKGPKKEYDQTGVKVGAARNQAIAFLAATKGSAFTLDDVDEMAYVIVKRQQRQEDLVRSGGLERQQEEEGLSNQQHNQDLDDEELPF